MQTFASRALHEVVTLTSVALLIGQHASIYLSIEVEYP
jgi:hypothetical protein